MTQQNISLSFIFAFSLLVLGGNVNSLTANELSSASKSAFEKASLKSPIGDNLHADVYFFITELLLKEKSLSRKKLKSILKAERQILQHNEDSSNEDRLKPRSADIREGEMASFLRILRDYYPGCEEIILYQHQGLEIVSSGSRNNITFTNKLDENYELGYLGNSPKDQIGIKKLVSREGKNYSLIIQFINYSPKQKFAYLSFSSPAKGHRTIGYLSYIIPVIDKKT